MLTCILLFLTKMVQANLFISQETNDWLIERCIEKICENSFEKSPVLAIFDNYNKMDYHPRLENAQINYNFEQDINWKDRFHYFNHLILVDDVRNIAGIFEKYRASPMFNPIYSPRGKVLIHSKTFTHFDETVKYFWDNNFIDLMFINGTDVFTTYPYWPETKCGKEVFYKHLGNCRNGFQSTWEPFPSNLNDCVINAATFGKHIQMPFLDDTNLLSERTGILIQPLRLAMSKYQLKINYIVPDDGLQLQKTIKGSPYFYDSLYKERLYDLLVVEVFRLDNTIGLFECSEIIFFEPNVWMTPKPKELSKLKVIFNVFAPSLWLCLLLVLLLVTTLLRSSTDRNLSESFLLIYSITIGTCAYNLPNNFKSRLLFSFYLLFSLHIIFFFQSKLSSVLTSPNRELPINNFERLAHSNLHLIFYYNINLQTLKRSYNPYVSLLANKSMLFEADVYNPPEVVLTHDNYSANSFQHFTNLTEAHKKRVRTLARFNLFN